MGATDIYNTHEIVFSQQFNTNNQRYSKQQQYSAQKADDGQKFRDSTLLYSQIDFKASKEELESNQDVNLHRSILSPKSHYTEFFTKQENYIKFVPKPKEKQMDDDEKLYPITVEEQLPVDNTS